MDHVSSVLEPTDEEISIEGVSDPTAFEVAWAKRVRRRIEVLRAGRPRSAPDASPSAAHEDSLELRRS